MTEPEKTKPTKPQEEADSELPPFYNAEGISGILKRAQASDPEWRHRMIQKHPSNQAMARSKGWVPIEDKALLERMGFPKETFNASGRFMHLDAELWRMPRSMADKIRKHISEKTWRKHGSVKAELDAMSSEIKGRTGGLVEPFAQMSDNILDRS